ncbi:PREDICTED: RING finger protein 186 [Crocodylus porosus]|uniref:RING finger protein 186 n=1 Tax=Crocodylus porosus TaxID=8502 RepID=UPI000939E4D7|nr:PREDICTED: RING finger protein 186 [Crocodylus porosus]
MEGPTNKLHFETESNSLGPMLAEVGRLAPTEEHAAEMEGLGSFSPSDTKLDSPHATESPEAEMDCPSSIKPPATAMDTPDTSKFLVSNADYRRSSKASIADMDCLICCNRYNIYRVPKLLACQHAFCAVCLKLIVRSEDRTWIITCPLCRKVTVVFGGLICTLRDKEDILSRLESPDTNTEMQLSPKELDNISGTQSSHAALHTDEHIASSNRLAIQRLVLLLLLVVILIIIVLPFTYAGLVKWVLCFVLTLGLIMSLILCCNPSFSCSCDRGSLSLCHKKESHIISIA